MNVAVCPASRVVRESVPTSKFATLGWVSVMVPEPVLVIVTGTVPGCEYDDGTLPNDTDVAEIP